MPLGVKFLTSRTFFLIIVIIFYYFKRTWIKKFPSLFQIVLAAELTLLLGNCQCPACSLEHPCSWGAGRSPRALRGTGACFINTAKHLGVKKKNHRSGSNLSKGKGLLVNGQLAYLFCKAQNLCLAIVAWAKADKGEETLPSCESN